MVTDRSGEIMAPDLPEDGMGHSAPFFPVGRSGLRAIRHGTSGIVPLPFCASGCPSRLGSFRAPNSQKGKCDRTDLCPG